VGPRLRWDDKWRNGLVGRQEIGDGRARLAEIELELAGLQARHDLAMSAFRFDEANALQRMIAALDDERRALTAALPPAPAAVEPPTRIVPVLVRPRRRR
jgi:hypothetical protein